ncbi:hypothetical protein IPJ72_00430 [Candidatus Peregrinibacteria bacterium]|nr:MAG: hypothetical protein IPJ72_00430 [Candidatus Peregrinibacteria bacterium]
MESQKSKTIPVLVGILVLAIAYLGVAYAMRDAGPGWCSMSGGEYKAEVFCNGYESNDLGGRMTDCIEREKKVCSYGWFGGARHVLSSPPRIHN